MNWHVVPALAGWALVDPRALDRSTLGRLKAGLHTDRPSSWRCGTDKE